jgi:hypothetical protein
MSLQTGFNARKMPLDIRSANLPMNLIFHARTPWQIPHTAGVDSTPAAGHAVGRGLSTFSKLPATDSIRHRFLVAEHLDTG